MINLIILRLNLNLTLYLILNGSPIPISFIKFIVKTIINEFV
jgi:hypothetical protein